MEINPHKALYIFSIIIFPVLSIFFAVTYKTDRMIYLRMLREDGLVEWLTFALFLLSGVISLVLAIRIRKRSNFHFLFFIIFFMLCIFFSLEEISWGQRIFNIESTKLFLEHSSQNEINIHNIFQKLFKLKTKHIAAVAFFFYGVCLPILLLNIDNVFQKLSRLRTKHIAAVALFLSGICLPILLLNIDDVFQKLSRLRTKHIVIIALFFSVTFLPILFNSKIRSYFYRIKFIFPPLVLSFGFLLGAIMMLDIPTGQEEEIGELFFSLCFCLFMIIQIIKTKDYMSTQM